MKKLLLSICVLSLSVMAQAEELPQLLNPGFEEWALYEAGKEDSNQPVSWNSFWSGKFAVTLGSAKAKQIEQSTDVRPGSVGSSSAKIYSRSIMGVVANGNMTTGRINASSVNAIDATKNYNFTNAADPKFHQVMTVKPDTFKVWVKFNPLNEADSARVCVVIHGQGNYQDPSATAKNDSLFVGAAIKNFTKGDGNWKQLSIPFEYIDTDVAPQFILVSITTNKTPGGGTAGDELFIDDIELAYTQTAISNVSIEQLSCYPNPVESTMQIDGTSDNQVSVYSIIGTKVMDAVLNNGQLNVSSLTQGRYILQLTTDKGTKAVVPFIKK